MKNLNLVWFGLVLQISLTVVAQDTNTVAPQGNELACAQKIDVKVNGLVCDFCARALDKTFNKQRNIDWIDIDLDQGNIVIATKPGGSLSDAQLTKLVLNAGYKTVAIKRVCL